MAKTAADTSAHSQGQDNKTVFQAGDADRIELPSSGFIAGSTMTKDGDDLILQAPDGEQVVIEGYFSAEPPPLLTAADGSALTPALVHSFAKSPQEYAANETANDESPVGAVEEVQGKATVTRADGTVEDIVIGTPIYQGDIIQTDAKGAVNIVFIDETSMAISQNARLAVDQYTFDPATESGTTNFSVLRGLFVFTSGLIGRDDPDDVKIETPVGSIGIRGTIIAGEIIPGGESNISVLEGAIVITNGTGNITLSEQFETIRVSGYDAPMQNLGVVPANDVGTRFNSIGAVLPSLFTTINDSSTQQQNTQPGAQPQSQQETPAQDAAPTSSNKAAPAPEATITADMPGNGLPSTQTALGQAPFTSPSHIASDNGLTNIAPSAGIAPPPSASAPVNNQTSTATQTTPTLPSEPQPLPQAPNTSGGNTTTVTPPPAIARLINLDQPTTHIDVISDGISNMAGYSISALGDLNRDGFADFIFSNDSGSQNLRYTAMGGASGIGSGNIPSLSRITVSANPTGTDFFGTEVSGIGDFNGDGTVDYVIGQPNRDTGYMDGGMTFVFSGANASHYSFNGDAASAQLGIQVTGIGDYNNDGYADVLIGTNMEHAVYIGGTSGTPVQSTINGDPATGFAAALIGIGDYNGDGYADFAISAPADMSGRGAIHIYTGNANGTLNVTNTLIGDTGQNIGTQLAAIGDINGDGVSDLLAAGSNNTGRLYFGAGGGSPISISAGGYDIIGGGGVGDFNGDGYDDFAISLANDSGSRTFVVLGKSSFSGDIDLAYLTNRDNAFEFTYSGMNNNSTPDIEGVGDVNGDGYDDFAMGVPDINGSAAGNGGMFLVYGRSPGNISSSSTATADGQHLVAASGRQNLSDGGFEDVSMRGTAAANNFEIHNTNFLGIHGGGNAAGSVDTIRAVGNLDFGNVNFESISGIERLMFTGNNQVITLSVENIFNLLKSSSGYTDGSFTSNGYFKIDGGGVTGATLILDADNTSGGGTNANIVSALNEMGSGATAENNMGNYRHFSIGGYDLLIDSNVTVDVA